MVADKILMEVTLDRETHDRLKKRTGINILNGTDLVRAVFMLLNQHDLKDGDNVNHPQHYEHGGMECIDEMLLIFGKDATMDFCALNAWKYRKRAMYKGTPEEDMKKSDAYLRCYKSLKEKGIAEF